MSIWWHMWRSWGTLNNSCYVGLHIAKCLESFPINKHWLTSLILVATKKYPSTFFKKEVKPVFGLVGKESACQCRRHKRHGFDPWVRKIPWKKEWLPTPVFLPGESHGQRNVGGLRSLGSCLCVYLLGCSRSQLGCVGSLVCLVRYFHYGTWTL